MCSDENVNVIFLEMNEEFVDDHDFETRSCSFFRYYLCSLLLRPNNSNVFSTFYEFACLVVFFGVVSPRLQ